MTAQEILQNVIEASGGDTWHSPQTLWLKGEAFFTPFGLTDEAHFLHFNQYELHRVFPTTNDSARTANGKIRFDARYGSQEFFSLRFDGVHSKMQLSERAKPYAKHFEWSNNFGFSIIRHALAQGFDLQRLTDDTFDGHDCFLIKLTDTKGGETFYGIDRQHFYIRYLHFQTAVGFHHRIYSDFVKVEGQNFIQPQRLRIYFEGIRWMDIRWQQFAVNQPIDDVVFNTDSPNR
ncbi:MAG: hypothetical protein ACK4GN_14730 [Runella sp.]